MNLHGVLRNLWRERLAVLVVAVIAVIVGILITYRVPSFRPRSLQMGVAQTSVLVDAAHSTLGNPHVSSSRFASVSANLTDLSNTRPIVDPIARALHVAPSTIGVQTQVTTQAPLSQIQPLEPQVGTEILGTRHRYFLVVRNDGGTQTVQYYAQAPTAAQALTMVRTAAKALQDYVAAEVRSGHVSRRDSIVIRELQTPFASTLDRDVTLDAAILIALLVWALGVIAVLTIRNQARHAATAQPLTQPSRV